MAEQQKERKRKKRKKTVLEHWLLYLLLRIFLAFVFLFPVESVLKFARRLGRALWKYYGRGRQRALENLRASFPEKDEKWIEETGIRSFECLLMLFVDILFLPRIIRKDAELIPAYSLLPIEHPSESIFPGDRLQGRVPTGIEPRRNLLEVRL
jgi:lauroyl/myristoyl acyltransferase